VELLEVRLLLEIESARLAAIRRTDEDLELMRNAVVQMGKEIKNGQTGLHGDNAFHKAISEAGNNRVLQQFVSMCGDLLEVEREEHLLNSKEEAEKALKQHKELLKAIEAGDEDKSQQLMSKHIHSISRVIKSNRLKDTQKIRKLSS
jgi:GntR family transcriptional regulator, transcriptional repressor for pyruvate dehydrogenase complex